MSEPTDPEPEAILSDAPTEHAVDDTGVAGSLPGSPSFAATEVLLNAGTESGWREKLEGGDDDLLGALLDGRYRIVARIAEGGMGVVYRARHAIIDKDVAIKVLRPEYLANAEVLQRFLTEAQAASAIGSEHIIDINDFGRLPSGATFIVMEFLDGESLGQRLERQERLSETETLSLSLQIAGALQAAHGASIIHRDLKPDNVFLKRRGSESFVKVLDFGIAKVASAENARTREGKVVGTPYYMSPEQASGKPVDHRTDVYALGVILYQCLTGRLPFVGDNALAVLSQHIYAEPAPLRSLAPDVSRGLAAVVHKCLSKAPEERYATMSELQSDLSRVAATGNSVAMTQVPAETLRPREHSGQAPPRNGSPRTRLLALFVVALLAGGVVLQWPAWTTWWRARQAPEHAVVDVVLSPIDAHLFQGDRDLGMMPLRVVVPDGKAMTLSVRREGFQTARVLVDGKQTRLAVSLQRDPGIRLDLAPPTTTAAGPPRTVTLLPESNTLADARDARAKPAPAPKEPRIPGPPPEPSAGEESEPGALTLPPIPDAGGPLQRAPEGPIAKLPANLEAADAGALPASSPARPPGVQARPTPPGASPPGPPPQASADD